MFLVGIFIDWWNSRNLLSLPWNIRESKLQLSWTDCILQWKKRSLFIQNDVQCNYMDGKHNKFFLPQCLLLAMHNSIILLSLLLRLVILLRRNLFSWSLKPAKMIHRRITVIAAMYGCIWVEIIGRTTYQLQWTVTVK